MIEKTVGRPPQAAPVEVSPQAPNAALLVDFDNVTMGIRSDLQTQLRKLLNSDIIRGKVSVQRAYADWRRYPQYIVPLTEASIDLIFAPAVGANKKNATDIRLAIDALELVFTRPEIGTFILLSGDSDFSALVLKLKEYGKFVIGVGIRESSSDLLVQNCDEYYSYNELTGLARTGEVEVVRRDPWELAVEAVQKMLRDGDVMRSDRLKQVMQSIAPDFDEKDVGCNRFSKFVVEAEKRGLLELNRMENGQYAVGLGPNANVQEERVVPVEAKAGTTETKATAHQRRRVPRAPSAGGDRDTPKRTLTLSEGFELLKRALTAVGAVGDNATEADRARKRMIEIHGNEADPVFETKRFIRMLRQAHDANVIELIKSGDDDYELKLSAPATTDSKKADTAEESKDEEQQQPVGKLSGETEAEAKPKRSGRKTTTRKSSRSRARAAAKDTADEEAASSAEAAAETEGEEPEKPKRTARKKTTTKKKTTKSRAKKTGADAQDELWESAGESEGKETAEEAVEATSKAGAEAADADKEAEASEKEKPKRTARKKATTARKKATTTRKKSTTARKSNGESTDEVAGEAPAEMGESGSEETEAKSETEPSETRKRDTSGDASADTARVRPKAAAPAAVFNPRFRKGSRTAAPKPPVGEKEGAATAAAEAAVPTTPAPKVSTAPPRLGRRSGSRSSRPTVESEQAAPPSQDGGQSGAQLDAADKEPQQPESRPGPASRESEPGPPTYESVLRESDADLPASESTSSPEEDKTPVTETAANVTPEHTKQDGSEDQSQEDGMSLFRRVSAAFQRAMGTGRDERE